MDLKIFKTDLTYFCKKAQKDGKIISVSDGNLFVNTENKLELIADRGCPLELFAIGKGYTSTTSLFLISDLVAQQAQISETSIKSFLEGLENCEGEVNEWYNLGIYIREKFSPIGARTVMLVPGKYQMPSNQYTEKKFYYVNTKKNFGVYQVELSDMHIPWLPVDEQKFVVQSPVFLKGEELMSWCLHDTPEDCMDYAKTSVRAGFEAGLRKRKIEYTEEDVQNSIAQLQVFML